MTPLLPLWSLHWSSNGELSPLDRHDLFQRLNLSGIALFQPSLGSAGTGPSSAESPKISDDLTFPYR